LDHVHGERESTDNIATVDGDFSVWRSATAATVTSHARRRENYFPSLGCVRFFPPFLSFFFFFFRDIDADDRYELAKFPSKKYDTSIQGFPLLADAPLFERKKKKERKIKFHFAIRQRGMMT